MWMVTRLAQFNRAFHSTDLSWRPSDAAAGLKFAEGLLLSFLLVTPFWTAVGVVLHRLTR
jgi:hypothetical protein